MKLKRVLLVGLCIVMLTTVLTGCGKKEEKSKIYDKDNEIIENSINYAEKLSVEQKIHIAYSLSDFDSASQISKNSVVCVMLGAIDNINKKATNDESVKELYKDVYNENEVGANETNWPIYEYDENQVKKAAKDLLDVTITESITNFNSMTIKYKDGKYYSMDIPADGEQLTIKNISNDGIKYTFYALNCLDSEEKDISEYKKYEAVIENGVIKSCKVVNNTEKNNKSTTDNKQTNEPKDFSESDLTFKGITLGMNKSEVEDMLGDAESEKSHTEDATGNVITELKYSSIKLDIEIEKDVPTDKEFVRSISYEGKDAVTRGLKVSSTYDEVINAFRSDSILRNEELGSEKIITVGYPNDDPVYNVDNKGKLIFVIDKNSNKVKSIAITYGHEN